jgi:hypothetical protein
VDNVDQMIKAILKVDQLDPHRCRGRVEVSFGRERMTDRCLRLHEETIHEAAPKPALATIGTEVLVLDRDRETAVA